MDVEVYRTGDSTLAEWGILVEDFQRCGGAACRSVCRPGPLLLLRN